MMYIRQANGTRRKAKYGDTADFFNSNFELVSITEVTAIVVSVRVTVSLDASVVPKEDVVITLLGSLAPCVDTRTSMVVFIDIVVVPITVVEGVVKTTAAPVVVITGESEEGFSVPFTVAKSGTTPSVVIVPLVSTLPVVEQGGILQGFAGLPTTPPTKASRNTTV